MLKNAAELPIDIPCVASTPSSCFYLMNLFLHPNLSHIALLILTRLSSINTIPLLRTSPWFNTSTWLQHAQML